jgi:hypothetical protein
MPALKRIKIAYALPDWVSGYSRAQVLTDLVAGLSLAAFVVPESLAYASLAGLAPVAGLYCFLASGFVYPLFGTSKQLAVGPTSAIAVVVSRPCDCRSWRPGTSCGVGCCDCDLVRPHMLCCTHAPPGANFQLHFRHHSPWI